MMKLIALLFFLMQRLTNFHRMGRIKTGEVTWFNRKVYDNDLTALSPRSFKERLWFGPPGATEETAMFKDRKFCLWQVILDLSWQVSTFQFKSISKGQKRFCLT